MKTEVSDVALWIIAITLAAALAPPLLFIVVPLALFDGWLHLPYRRRYRG